jgi:parvulin-like peptidyl-prolyl isomerase
VKRLAIALICLALFAAACSRPKHAAATVNGATITDQDVVDELNAIVSNDDYLQQVEAQLGGGRVRGDSEGSFDSAFVAQVLRGRIAYSLVHQELERRKIVIDDTCRSAAQQDAYKSVGGDDLTKGKEILDAFPATFRETLLTRNTEVLALQAHLIDLPCQPQDAARLYFDAHPEKFAQTCLTVMAVDPDKADAVYAQLKAGADFATVAQANATDGIGSQEVGCVVVTQLPQTIAAELAQTATGQIAKPVQNGTVSIIMRVNDRKTGTFDELRTQAEEVAAVAQSDAFRQWYQDALIGAAVTVDVRYGTWNAEQGAIDPPAEPSTTTTVQGAPGN